MLCCGSGHSVTCDDVKLTMEKKFRLIKNNTQQPAWYSLHQKILQSAKEIYGVFWINSWFLDKD